MKQNWIEQKKTKTILTYVYCEERKYKYKNIFIEKYTNNYNKQGLLGFRDLDQENFLKDRK